MLLLSRLPFRYLQKSRRQQTVRRRCVLHAGSSKCGTSSIQYMLKANRKRLLKRGILVPESGQRPKGAHHILAYHLADLSAGPTESVKQKFIQEVSDSPAHTVLISAENLGPLLAVPAKAEHLIEGLKALDFEITIVIYVRNQPQFLNSSYVQSVKTWLQADEFDVFASRVLMNHRKYTHSHWIEFAGRRGVELLARPFSREVRDIGVTADFLATVGLSSTKGIDTAVRRNVSVGPFSVEVARSLLRRMGGPDNLTQAQTKQGRLAFEAELKRRRIEDRGYCGLTTSLAAEVERRFADDNERFAQYAWHKPWQEVFASDIGQSFEPNDYSVTGVPVERQDLLSEVLASLESKLDSILAADDASRRTYQFHF